MSDDTQKYIDQIKQGWNQLSTGVVEQVKKYTGIDAGEGVNILPSNLMSMSSEETTDKPKGEASKGDNSPARTQKQLADDPLGLGFSSDAERPKGKRITEANTEYAKVAEAQRIPTGGGEPSADDPLGLGK